MSLFLILVGFLGAVMGLLLLVFNFVRKEPKKGSILLMIISIIIIIVGFSLGYNKQAKENNLIVDEKAKQNQSSI